MPPIHFPASATAQVANTYLVASGAPAPVSAEILEAYGGSHEAALGRFCLDVISLLDNGLPPSIQVGRVTAKIGLHTGPVTAGIIGVSRRYYRLFGDTVNVSSSKY